MSMSGQTADSFEEFQNIEIGANNASTDKKQKKSLGFLKSTKKVYNKFLKGKFLHDILSSNLSLFLILGILIAIMTYSSIENLNYVSKEILDLSEDMTIWFSKGVSIVLEFILFVSAAHKWRKFHNKFVYVTIFILIGSFMFRIVGTESIDFNNENFKVFKDIFALSMKILFIGAIASIAPIFMSKSATAIFKKFDKKKKSNKKISPEIELEIVKTLKNTDLSNRQIAGFHKVSHTQINTIAQKNGIKKETAGVVK